VSPALVRNGFLDLGLGFVLGTGFAFLLDGLIHPSAWNRNSRKFAAPSKAQVTAKIVHLEEVLRACFKTASVAPGMAMANLRSSYR
jgi:hypothetical protein